MGYNSSKIIKNLDNNILSYLYSEAGKAFNYKQIAAAISLKDPAGKQLVKDSLFRLSQKNKIAEAERGKYMVKRVANTIRGTIDFNKRGMAYLITEGEASDIKIEKNKTANALQADTVLAKVNRQKNGKLIAEVVEVIARNKTKFTGTIEVNKTNAFVRPDTTKIHVDFYIDLDDVNGAKHGEKVIVELSEWKASLLAEQRLWISYKMASCKFYNTSEEFGSIGWSIQLPHCRAKVISDRVNQLNDYRRDIGE